MYLWHKPRTLTIVYFNPNTLHINFKMKLLQEPVTQAIGQRV